MIFYAKAKDGQLDWSNKNALFKYLVSLDGKDVYADIDLEKTKRTLKQNDWLWLVYKLIGEHTGHSATELHEIFKRMFLPPRFIMYKGQQIKLPASTTALSKNDFSEYVERIRAEAGSLGLTIPDPDPELSTR